MGLFICGKGNMLAETNGLFICGMGYAGGLICKYSQAEEGISLPVYSLMNI